MACGIYLITHKDTSQKYVGQSVDIARRWRHHIRGYDLEHSRVERAIRKHGVDKFDFQILTELPNDIKTLNIHEKYWIKFYNTYEDKNHYNLTPGGDFNPMRVPEIARRMSGENHSFFGQHHTLETRRKISESRMGIGRGKRNLAVSESNHRRTGRNHPLYGKNPSEETLRKQSKSKMGEKNSNWGTSKLEQYGGLDVLFEAIERGKTQEDVANKLGISVGAIVSYLHTRGYSWITLKKKLNRAQKYGVIDNHGGLNFLKDCIKGGKTQEDIVKELGLNTVSNIHTYLKYEGYTWAKLIEEVFGYERRSIIDDFGGLDFLKECIREGKSQEAVAKEIGIASTSLESYLKTRGYNWTKLKEEATGKKQCSIDDLGGLDFLKKCIEEGKTKKEITKELGLNNNSSVTYYLNKRGYTWTTFKKEVLGNQHYSIIDNHGGLDFLRKCIKEGKSKEDVAEELNITVGTIAYYLEKRDYNWVKLKKEIFGRERTPIIDKHGGLDFLRKCIKEGKSQNAVAKEIGITRTTLQYYIKNRGYSWAKLKEEATGKKQYSIDDLGGLDFLRKYIKEGKTKKDISAEFKISVSTIDRYLKKRGYNWSQLKKELNMG